MGGFCYFREATCMTSPNTIIADLTAEVETLRKQLAEIVKLAEVIEINAEECLDFDEYTAMLVPIDDYTNLIEAITNSKCGS